MLDASDSNITGLIYRDPEGWIPIQTRGQFPSYPQDFFSVRNWSDYANGFGQLGMLNTIQFFLKKTA